MTQNEALTTTVHLATLQCSHLLKNPAWVLSKIANTSLTAAAAFAGCGPLQLFLGGKKTQTNKQKTQHQTPTLAKPRPGVKKRNHIQK